jgi:acetyl esterase
MLKANPRPTVTVENIAAMRPLAPQGMAMLEPPVGDLALTRDAVVPGPGGKIPIRMFDARATREPGPAVVFFHGGGFVMGCIDTHVSMCAEIARRLDLPVISVDYRLAPEDPWPACADDGEAAVRWITENGGVFNRTITSLVLCGDSAGGNLALVAALALRDKPAAVPVILQIALYPATDPTGHYPSNDAFGDGYGLDAADMRFYNSVFKPEPGHWRASPVVADQTGMPPLLMITAGLDPLRDQGRAHAAKSIAAGVPTTYREFVGTIHGFLGFRRVIPSAAQDFVVVLELAQAMIREALAGQPA